MDESGLRGRHRGLVIPGQTTTSDIQLKAANSLPRYPTRYHLLSVLLLRGRGSLTQGGTLEYLSRLLQHLPESADHGDTQCGPHYCRVACGLAGPDPVTLLLVKSCQQQLLLLPSVIRLAASTNHSLQTDVRPGAIYTATTLTELLPGILRL